MSSKPVTRREFVTLASQVAAAAALFSLSPAAALAAGRRRFAIVGTGSRACGMSGSALIKRFPDLLEFVGVLRHQLQARRSCQAQDGRGVPRRSLNSTRCASRSSPSCCLIATVDAMHADYIVKGARPRHRCYHRKTDGYRREAVPRGAGCREAQRA